MGSKTQEGSAQAGFKGRLPDDDMRFCLPEEWGGRHTEQVNQREKTALRASFTETFVAILAWVSVGATKRVQFPKIKGGRNQLRLLQRQ